MDLDTAQQRLTQEHENLHELLLSSAARAIEDRANTDNEPADGGEALAVEGENDAVTASVRDRLTKVHAALDRLHDGTYGRSVRSGEIISDERLEADPAAELTVEEAQLGSATSRDRS